MNFDLPAEAIALGAVVRKQSSSFGEQPASEWLEVLESVGVFNLLGPESPDPAHAHTNVAVVLRALAAEGRTGPFAETIWARSTGEVPTDGWIGWPSDLVGSGGARLIPYGEVCRYVISDLVDNRPVAASLDATVPAHIVVDRGHVWDVVSERAPSFEAHAGAFAHRAGAALTLGYAERALEMAADHARSRVQFGRPIGSFQSLQFRLAEARWRVDGLDLLVREAAWRADRASAIAAAVSALAWIYARQVGRLVDRHAHQVFGAIGFSDELGVTRLTGAMAVLRVNQPATRAVTTIWATRDTAGEPASTVLGGFVS